MKTNFGIYKITSPTGKLYIGQSRDIAQRWKHYRALHKIKGQRMLYNSLCKHGVENHTFEIAYELPNDTPFEVLTNYEHFFIEQFKEAGFEMMNLKDAGIHGSYSQESKDKMRQSQLGKKAKPETIAKRVSKMKGRKHTDEAKRKISIGNKGKRAGQNTTEEVKAKLRKANLGKTLSDEHKAKIGLSNKVKIHNKMSEETKLKIKNAITGIKRTKQQIEKSSVSRTGQKRTEEAKEKMRKARFDYLHQQKKNLGYNGQAEIGM